MSTHLYAVDVDGSVAMRNARWDEAGSAVSLSLWHANRLDWSRLAADNEQGQARVWPHFCWRLPSA